MCVLKFMNIELMHAVFSIKWSFENICRKNMSEKVATIFNQMLPAAIRIPRIFSPR